MIRMSELATMSAWAVAVVLLLGNVVNAQTLPRFSRADSALLLEYDRYSLKMERPDKTPLLRVYGSGRVEIYYSVFSPKAGLYETQLNAAELDALVLQLVNAGLDLNVSAALAESAEQAAIAQQNAGGALYYSSEATVSVLNMYWAGAGNDPLLMDNLQETDRRFPSLPQVSNLAGIERQLLNLAGGDLGQPIAAAKSLSGRKQQ